MATLLFSRIKWRGLLVCRVPCRGSAIDRADVAASGCVSGQDRRWNHNIHYYPLILAAIPPGCQRVLDVGCGEGMLARQLAHRVPRVVGIDQDSASIELARRQGPAGQIEFVHGDFLTHSFPPASFGLITCPVAAARPALGCGRGHRQPRPPGDQGLLATSVAYRVAAPALLPPDPRARRGNVAGREIPAAPAVAVLPGLGQASVVEVRRQHAHLPA